MGTMRACLHPCTSLEERDLEVIIYINIGDACCAFKDGVARSLGERYPLLRQKFLVFG